MRNYIIPISSQIIVTENLPEEIAAELIPNGRTISKLDRITNYYRLLPGDRPSDVWRSCSTQFYTPDYSAKLLHDMMIKRWPQIKDARITHSWSGFVAMTVDSLPHIGLKMESTFAPVVMEVE